MKKRGSSFEGIARRRFFVHRVANKQTWNSFCSGRRKLWFLLNNFWRRFQIISKCISQTIWIETTVILSQRLPNSFQLTHDIVLSRLHKILGYLKRFLDVHCHRNPWIQFNLKVYVHRPSIEQALNTTHSCHPSNHQDPTKEKALTNAWVICCNKVAGRLWNQSTGHRKACEIWQSRVSGIVFFSSVMRNGKRSWVQWQCDK